MFSSNALESEWSAFEGMVKVLTHLIFLNGINDFFLKSIPDHSTIILSNNPSD